MKLNIRYIHLVFPGRLAYQLSCWFWCNLEDIVTGAWRNLIHFGKDHAKCLKSDRDGESSFEMYQWGPFQLLASCYSRSWTTSIYWGTEKHQMLRSITGFNSSWWDEKVRGH